MNEVKLKVRVVITQFIIEHGSITKEELADIVKSLCSDAEYSCGYSISYDGFTMTVIKRPHS